MRSLTVFGSGTCWNSSRGPRALGIPAGGGRRPRHAAVDLDGVVVAWRCRRRRARGSCRGGPRSRSRRLPPRSGSAGAGRRQSMAIWNVGGSSTVLRSGASKRSSSRAISAPWCSDLAVDVQHEGGHRVLGVRAFRRPARPGQPVGVERRARRRSRRRGGGRASASPPAAVSGQSVVGVVDRAVAEVVGRPARRRRRWRCGPCARRSWSTAAGRARDREVDDRVAGAGGHRRRRLGARPRRLQHPGTGSHRYCSSVSDVEAGPQDAVPLELQLVERARASNRSSMARDGTTRMRTVSVLLRAECVLDGRRRRPSTTGRLLAAARRCSRPGRTGPARSSPTASA